MLTQRETSTLILVSQGYTVPAIASARGTSTSTEWDRIRSICTKLNARNKTHAVSRGFELGILR